MVDSAPQAPARPHAQLQRRGVERVRVILDAAELILEAEGYEAATLKAIGERAGIPTASMYHYFSDRSQVDAELIRRHVGALDDRISTGLADRPPASLPEAVDAVVAPMLAYFREHPSCVELWFARRSDPLDEIVRAFDSSMAQRLWSLSLDRGLLRADTPPLVMQLAFEAGTALFDAAFRAKPGSGDSAVLEESRRLLVAYLQTYASA